MYIFFYIFAEFLSLIGNFQKLDMTYESKNQGGYEWGFHFIDILTFAACESLKLFVANFIYHKNIVCPYQKFCVLGF